MGRTYDEVDERLSDFLGRQHVFFVATAPSGSGGHVNLSPKGLHGTFSVLDPDTVAYLDLTGSGVETIAHLRDNGRIVIMFCAFDGPPRIVRLHGRGEAVLADDPRFGDLAANFPTRPGIRSVILVRVERISDSCGYGVPLMRFEAERDQLDRWAERKGPQGIVEYHATRNSESIDGLPGTVAGRGAVPEPGVVRRGE
ncbi:MAG TPA: pyridoxamine 5'-phosphate oxidase family protein [Acidimicrobiales bacterium]|nr:pyridoxamine 5'-phosphate oxidase family protein [Acidimicrobiales bacterium]